MKVVFRWTGFVLDGKKWRPDAEFKQFMNWLLRWASYWFIKFITFWAHISECSRHEKFVNKVKMQCIVGYLKPLKTPGRGCIQPRPVQQSWCCPTGGFCLHAKSEYSPIRKHSKLEISLILVLILVEDQGLRGPYCFSFHHTGCLCLSPRASLKCLLLSKFNL